MRWPYNNVTTRSQSQLDERFKLSGLNEITISDKSPQKCVRASTTEPMHMWNAHTHTYTHMQASTCSHKKHMHRRLSAMLHNKTRWQGDTRT